MKHLKNGFGYVFLILISLFSIFPFYWMVVGSTNSSLDILSGKLTFGTQFFENWKILFGKYNMFHILLNSFKISFLTVFGVLVVTSMAAYGFQIFRTKNKEKVYSLFMLTMMVPFATLMIPLFKMFSSVNLLDSHFAVIIVGVASVFMIFFFRQSFSTYPVEIIQAARVDGASELTIFTKVFVPSMKSTYFAAAIYAFMTSWNSYLWPLIILQSNGQKTTTLLISFLSSSYTPEYGVIMLAIVISTLPVIIIFFALQTQFVEGMTGSVKQ